MRAMQMRTARTSSIGGLLDKLLAGAPDAITSGWCLWIWTDPLALGNSAVKGVVLMMLMEFILINATGFFTVIPFMMDTSRATRLAMMLGLCAIYILLVTAFALPFHALWPFAAFGWLAFGKLVWILRNRRTSDSDQMWLMGGWAFSVAAYLGAVGAGATMDLPTLGITPAIVPLLHLPGGGEWVETPHKAVAAAVFYFAALALFKWLHALLRGGRSEPG
jgi:hypothetical protein